MSGVHKNNCYSQMIGGTDCNCGANEELTAIAEGLALAADRLEEGKAVEPERLGRYAARLHALATGGEVLG
jgi:hypothetical protein